MCIYIRVNKWESSFQKEKEKKKREEEEEERYKVNYNLFNSSFFFSIEITTFKYIYNRHF